MSRYVVVPGRADTRGYCGLFAPSTTVTFSGVSIETEKPFGTPFDQRPGHWSRKRQKLSAQGAASSASPSAATELSATETAAKEAKAE